MNGTAYKEVRDAIRRFGMLIFKATIGTISADERAELDLLAVEAPALIETNAEYKK